MSETAYLKQLNFGDGVNRNLTDSQAIHTISVNGISQSVVNNTVNLDVATNPITEAQWTRLQAALSTS